MSWEAFREREDPHALGLCCRYALLTASVNSLASTYPEEAIVCLIQCGIWTTSEALFYARQQPAEADRAKALDVVTPHLPISIRDTVAQELLDLLPQVYLTGVASNILVNLAPLLSAPLLNTALSVARQRGVLDRVQMLAGLAPYLSPSTKREVVDEAIALLDQDPGNRIHLLSILAPYLSKHLIDEALEIARSPEAKMNGARLLVALAPHLPEPLSEQVLFEGVTKAKSYGIDSWFYFVEFSAPRLPHSMKELILEEALTALSDGQVRRPAEAIVQLAIHLPRHMRSRALSIARSIASKTERITAMAAVAQFIPLPEKEAILHEVFLFCNNIDDALSQVRALCALLPYLKSNNKNEVVLHALSLAYRAESDWERSMALIELIPHLSLSDREQVVSEVFESSKNVADASENMSVLVALLKCGCPVEQTVFVLYHQTRSEVLVGIAPHIPTPLLDQTLLLAREIAWEPGRAKALAALAPRLDLPHQNDIWEEVLGLAAIIDDGYLRSWVLGSAIPYLPMNLLLGALSLAEGDVIHSALPIAIAERLGNLDFHIEKILFERANDMTNHVGSVQGLVEALVALLPHFSFGERQSVVQVVLEQVRNNTETRSVYERAMVFAALIPHLRLDEQINVLRQALELSDELESEALHDLITKLCPWLHLLPKHVVNDTIHRWISRMAGKTRSNLLQIVAAVASVIESNAGEEAVAETVSAVIDSAKWWP